jgi:hypothetical protein
MVAPMGHLDEKLFDQAIAGCPTCASKAFEVSTYLDRKVSLMLADANDAGTWVHDGEKFIDGVFRITCLGCKTDAYSSTDCPRCHRAGGLADVLDTRSRLTVPKRCPSCRGTETTIIGFARATVRVGEGRPATPTPVTAFGDPGFHVIAVGCDACDWAQVAEGCPLCGHAGPLRVRP